MILRRQQHKIQGSSERGKLLTLGGTPAPLGGRALIAKVRLVRRGRGPGCFIVRVAGTSNFRRDEFSNCTHQNSLKICQLVGNGELGTFTLMTRND